MTCRWIFVLLILVVAGGCGSSSIISDSDRARPLHERGKTVVAFWHTYNDQESRLLEQELIPAFERDNPEIRVETVSLAFNLELKNTLIARASSGRGPDVVRIDVTWVPEFAHKGLLVPLSGMPGFENIRSRFHPKTMDEGLYRNDYYSLPLDRFTKAAVFNRALLERAGYTHPPQTMEEVIGLARRHKWPIGLEGLRVWDTLSFVYNLGGDLTDATAGRASGYFNSERTIRAVGLLKALYDEKLLKVEAEPGDTAVKLKDGSLLMAEQGPWFYKNLGHAELDRALETTVPAPFPGGRGFSSIFAGDYLVIMKGSRQQAAAWKFMTWMTGKESQLVMAKAGLIPASREADSAWTPEPYLEPFEQSEDKAIFRPRVKNWSKIEKVYAEYMQKIFVGELSVKDGLDRAAVQLDRLLADDGTKPNGN